MLGYATPPLAGHGVPVFVNMHQNITPEQFMNLGAELATSGSVALYHIVGVTPEAPSLDAAFHGEKPQREITITNEVLQKVQEKISAKPGKIDFALFGCPHFTIKQVREIAEMVAGKTLKAKLWIMTSALTKELAKKMGYLEIINDVGGDIVADTCWDQPCWEFLSNKRGVTDSAKMAFYSKRRDMEFIVRSVPECIEAAIKGVVQ